MFEKERAFKVGYVIGTIIIGVLMAFFAVFTAYGLVKLAFYANHTFGALFVYFFALYKLSDWMDKAYKWAIWNRLGLWLTNKLKVTNKNVNKK